MELTDQTIADHAIPLVQRTLAIQARELIDQLTPNQKIEVALVLVYEVSKRLGTPSIHLLVPKKSFEERIKKVFAIAQYLSVETLLELVIEILEQPTDQNE